MIVKINKYRVSETVCINSISSKPFLIVRFTTNCRSNWITVHSPTTVTTDFRKLNPIEDSSYFSQHCEVVCIASESVAFVLHSGMPENLLRVTVVRKIAFQSTSWNIHQGNYPQDLWWDFNSRPTRVVGNFLKVLFTATRQSGCNCTIHCEESGRRIRFSLRDREGPRLQ